MPSYDRECVGKVNPLNPSIPYRYQLRGLRVGPIRNREADGLPLFVLVSKKGNLHQKQGNNILHPRSANLPMGDPYSRKILNCPAIEIYEYTRKKLRYNYAELGCLSRIINREKGVNCIREIFVLAGAKATTDTKDVSRAGQGVDSH